MSALFPSLFKEILFWVVLFGGFAWIALATRKAGGDKEPDSKKAPESPLVVAISFLFAFVIPILVGYLRIGVLPSYLFYPGLAIWITGWVICGWGILTLGRFYSGDVRVIADHRVVQKGLYRLVRHPIYAGEILISIGLGLAVQSWIALLFIVIRTPIYPGSRIRLEERFLATELGDEYVQYMKGVKRLIPHVL